MHTSDVLRLHQSANGAVSIKQKLNNKFLLDLRLFPVVDSVIGVSCLFLPATIVATGGFRLVAGRRGRHYVAAVNRLPHSTSVDLLGNVDGLVNGDVHDVAVGHLNLKVPAALRHVCQLNLVGFGCLF